MPLFCLEGSKGSKGKPKHVVNAKVHAPTEFAPIGTFCDALPFGVAHFLGCQFLGLLRPILFGNGCTFVQTVPPPINILRPCVSPFHDMLQETFIVQLYNEGTPGLWQNK